MSRNRNEKSRTDKCEKSVLAEPSAVFELQQAVKCNAGWMDPDCSLCCGKLWKFLTSLTEMLKKRHRGLHPAKNRRCSSSLKVDLWLHPSFSAYPRCVTQHMPRASRLEYLMRKDFGSDVKTENGDAPGERAQGKDQERSYPPCFPSSVLGQPHTYTFWASILTLMGSRSTYCANW